MKSLIKKITPSWMLSFYHYILAFLAALIYRFPGYKLQIIGITGTNGKTTVTHLLSQILQKAGCKTASISSLRFKMGAEEWPNTLKMTMPGPFILQKFLANAVKAGCTHVVLEVTSEGIKQHRHMHIPFKGAVLTNITKEHIESHGGFAQYKKAKQKLFHLIEKYRRPKNFLVVNLDDPSAKDFSNFATAQKFGYMTDHRKKCPITTIKCIAAKKIVTSNKIRFEIQGYPDTIFQSPLYGTFNVSNILAAICAALAENIRTSTIQTVIKDYQLTSGRMETVIQKPFKAIVDYAHTPDALQKAYSSISHDKKKLICVLGAAGGGRDKWKRKELGSIAAHYCNKIFITNEDPYDENPEHIMEEVAQGVILGGKEAKQILDRKQAIKEALRTAKRGETVIITGKGAEPWMAVEKGKKIPWDDRKIVVEAFEELQQKTETKTKKGKRKTRIKA